MEKILDAAEPACVAADPLDQAARICIDSRLRLGRPALACPSEQRAAIASSGGA